VGEAAQLVVIMVFSWFLNGHTPGLTGVIWSRFFGCPPGDLVIMVISGLAMGEACWLAPTSYVTSYD